MSVREERNCDTDTEFWVRRFISSILYYRIYRKIFPGTPWYSPGAIRFLKYKLNKKFKVFEYGSGQSSVWYSLHVREYFGVENNNQWYNSISSRLKNEKAKILFAPTKEAYVHSIDNYPDKYFELISIDGRHRVDCLCAAIPKLQDDGYIVFDDSQRPKYNKIFEIMNQWKSFVYDFGIIQTTIFTK